jgi:hypothetical protein
MNTEFRFALLIAAVALAGIGGLTLLDQSDVSDADYNYTYGTVDMVTGVSYSFDTSAYYPPGNWSSQGTWSIVSGSVPGMTLSAGTNSATYGGSPTTGGDYTVVFKKSFSGSSNNPVMTVTYHVVNNSATVTYSAGIGTFNGSSTTTERVVIGSFASLSPVPTYSSGAFTFKGWALPGTTTVLTSYTVTGDVTLNAVWQNNKAAVGTWSATISHGQTASYTYPTEPSNASLSIASTGGLNGVSLNGKTITVTIDDNQAPGRYYVMITASASGYISNSVQTTVIVPIKIVPPIEYTLVLGQSFHYEPVTNPSNASVSVTSVKLNGSAVSGHGFSVSGRTITGTPSSTGTYDITFNVAASGYTSTAKTVRIFVSEPSVTAEPPSIGGVTAVQRADEPRTWDLIATGLSHVENIEWIYNGNVFASSSNTAIIEFPTAGFYTVTAKGYGADGSSVTSDRIIFVADTYHPELAWVGVPYANVMTYAGSSSIPEGSWLSSQICDPYSDGQYILIQGTPTATGTFTYTVDSQTYTVTVYQKQNEAPYSEFGYVLSENKRTVSVTFTGTNASVVYYNYGDSAGWITDTTHTYAVSEGYFTIRALAVNNISERESSHMVAVGGIDEEKPTIHPQDITDVTVKQGETVVIRLSLESGDVVSLSGPASEFLEVVDGNTVAGSTENVAPGVYPLTVTVTHSDGSKTESTVDITVREKDKDPPATFGFRVVIYLLAFILIVGLAIGLYITRDKKKGRKGRKGYRRNRSHGYGGNRR